MRTKAESRSQEALNVGDLTICCVNFKSATIINMNLDWISRWYVEKPPKWEIIDNSGEFHVLEKYESFASARTGSSPPSRKNKPDRKALWESLHHAQGINQALEFVNTRFALVIDPDFLIVNPRLISQLLQHMLSESIALLGVPWHPRWIYHKRYSPAPQFMIIDRSLFAEEPLDFTPDDRPLTARKPPVMLRVMYRLPLLKRHTLPEIRSRIGQVGDTGSQLQELAKRKHLKTETLTVVFHPDRCFTSKDDYIGKLPGIELIGTPLGRFVDALLPDSWRLIPKKEHYWTDSSFSEHHLPNFYSRGWEEFFWKDKPLGIHLRSFPKRASGTQQVELENEYRTAIDELSQIASLRLQ